MYVANPFNRPPKLKGKRVLVVEDEALVSMLVEDELRDAGATVLGPAACLDDALRLVEAAAADGGMDVAVLDLNLGGEWATPVADKLAALGVPFLFATGYGESCDTGGHGAAPALRKPFAPERLVATVEALTAKRTPSTPSGRTEGGRHSPDRLRGGGGARACRCARRSGRLAKRSEGRVGPRKPQREQVGRC